MESTQCIGSGKYKGVESTQYIGRGKYTGVESTQYIGSGKYKGVESIRVLACNMYGTRGQVRQRQLLYRGQGNGPVGKGNVNC